MITYLAPGQDLLSWHNQLAGYNQATTLVNTVNCVGVMGTGLAAQFKRRYPEMFSDYRQACKRGEIVIGKMWMWRGIYPGFGSVTIINFPTKGHWRDRSRLEWIEVGLKDLRQIILQHKFPSIAIPALGCGLGGLSWKDVQPRIDSALRDIPRTSIEVYPPASS